MIAKVETDLHAELDLIDPEKRVDVLSDIWLLHASQPFSSKSTAHSTEVSSEA
jgi:hypothetical protein